MSEKGKSVKAETKQTNAKGDASKTSTSKAETSTANAESKAKETTSNSAEPATKSDAPKSASQASISHFSSVSTPQYRSGWDKIFGKSAEEQPSAEQSNKYERRKALVAEQWRSYQETKNPKYLAIICTELPFFDHPEVGEEIASLLLKK